MGSSTLGSGIAESGIEREFNIIPSVRRHKDLPLAFSAPSPYVLLNDINIVQLKEQAALVRASNKITLVTPDLIGGFNPCREGMRLLKEHFLVNGILSANLSQLAMAKSEGLITIQRLFLFDSYAWDNAIKAIKNTHVDAVEILPGPLAIKFASTLKKKGVPMLAGGFIKTRTEVRNLFAASFSGVTTSEKDLWKLDSSQLSGTP